MTEPSPVQNAWTVYQQAAINLYAAAGEGGVDETRGGAEIGAEERDQRSKAVVASSRQLGDALADALQTEDLDQRELVTWKLLAAAAHDLSIAGDLLAAEEAGPEAAPSRGARSAIASEPALKAVLEAPLDTKPTDFVEVTRGAVLPAQPGPAREQLQTTIDVFVEEIPDAAASMSQKAATGLISAGLAPAQQVLVAAADGVLGMVPDAASAVVRHAAALLSEAIRKLLSSFPKEFQDQAAGQVATWLKAIQDSQETVEGLLDKFYETPQISEATHDLVKGAPEELPAGRFNQATEGLGVLMARYTQTQKIVEGCLRVLAFVKVPLMAALPWGPVGVYSTYAGVLVYAIFSGGDYLDADRLSKWAWMDRVQGMQATVRVAVQGKPPAPG